MNNLKLCFSDNLHLRERWEPINEIVSTIQHLSLNDCGLLIKRVNNPQHQEFLVSMAKNNEAIPNSIKDLLIKAYAQ